MDAQHKPTPEKVSVQLWVPPDLREGFRKAVRRNDLTVAQALRSHMREVVAVEAEQERQAA